MYDVYLPLLIFLSVKRVCSGASVSKSNRIEQNLTFPGSFGFEPHRIGAVGNSAYRVGLLAQLKAAPTKWESGSFVFEPHRIVTVWFEPVAVGNSAYQIMGVQSVLCAYVVFEFTIGTYAVEWFKVSRFDPLWGSPAYAGDLHSIIHVAPLGLRICFKST